MDIIQNLPAGRKQTMSQIQKLTIKGYRFGLSSTVDNRFLFEFEESQFFGGEYKVANHTRPLLGQGHDESKLKEAKDDYSK